MDFGPFAQQFVAAGGRHAFGIPGGGPSLALIDALAQCGVRFTATGHEATAALMAAACTRHSGQPALAISIKGPGFINLVPALLSNSYEGYASLSVSEAYPADDASGRAHKSLDHAGVGRAFLRAHHHFQESPEDFAVGWKRATAEFPGPVHLDLSRGPQCLEPAAPQSEPITFPWRETLRQSRQPVVIVGSLALRAKWRHALNALRCPVFTTVAGKGAVPELDPHAAGIYTGDGLALAPETHILPVADLVLCVGVRSGEVLSPKRPHPQTLSLDSDQVQHGSLFPKNVYSPPILSLPDAEIAEALELCAGRNWGLELVAAARARLAEQLQSWGWSPYEALRTVQHDLPNAAHVVDTGNFSVVAEHALVAQHERDFTGTPNGRFMGVGLGYALGACVPAGPRPVVLWVGDGGLRSYFSELALAAEQKFPLLVVVLKDGFYGSIRARARSMGWNEAPLTLTPRRLRAQAEAMGCHTASARSATQLAEALARWQPAGSPGLIECEFDAETYQRIIQQLR